MCGIIDSVKREECIDEGIFKEDYYVSDSGSTY